VGPGRADELPALGQRVAERRPQLVGLGSGEFVALASERYGDCVGAGTEVTLGGEFLDQPPTGDFLYPPDLTSGGSPATFHLTVRTGAT
jgi:hypothetical protein